jgi:UDP-glucuronate 4-epimerase
LRRVFITGSAGFIGFHLANALLDAGCIVHGFDGMTTYYDPALKAQRHAMLGARAGFSATCAMLEDMDALRRAAQDFRPDVIVHLAAQAGVRYSLEQPRAYVDSNVLGTFNVLEIARELGVSHLMVASTSSVYGANTKMPFCETDACDTPLTIYAATKKATEAMGHSYAHIHQLPMTFFRFFTVYGPWGRPDMAPILFANGIMTGMPIRVYNHGQMWRDFTYVSDLVRAIVLLMDAPPVMGNPVAHDSLSAAAPFRVVNIGQSQKVLLLDFIAALEDALGRKAIREYLPMQTGDVAMTWADTRLLQALTGFVPQTDMRTGVTQFAKWYLDQYHRS